MSGPDGDRIESVPLADLGVDAPPGASDASADVVTVSELSEELESLVEASGHVHHDYVLGDVTDCTTSGRHTYFDLTHDGAKLNCVLFGGRSARVSTTPENDLRVLVEGDLQYYSPFGQVSLVVTDVHEVGEAAYAEVYEQTRSQLAEEGLFDDERKRPIPALPGTVGLVTSRDSDARTDAVRAIHDRYPDVDVVVVHARVQGEAAVAEVVEAIERVDADPDVDLAVVTRGGGADDTLRVFNELAVCRTVARTETPIAVGVGHENDRTLAGEVADVRIMTPTDAGRLVPERAEYEAAVERHREALSTAYATAVSQRLDEHAERLDDAYRRRVGANLNEYRTALERAAGSTIERELSTLATELDHAYEAVRRENRHERELQRAVESTRADVTASVEAAADAEVAAVRRRYRIAVAVLVLLVVGLLVALVLTTL